AVVAFPANDVEPHDAPQQAIRASILQYDLAAERAQGKIDDDLDTFRHRERDRRRHDGRRKQSLVGRDLNEWLLVAERKQEGHRVRGIDDAKAVLPRGHLENRPGCAVYEHDAAGRAMMALMVVVEFA